MNEMTAQYIALKQQAIQLMQHGQVSAYLAKLNEVNDLWLRLVQVRLAN